MQAVILYIVSKNFFDCWLFSTDLSYGLVLLGPPDYSSGGYMASTSKLER